MGFILPQEEMGKEKVDDMWKREVSTQKSRNLLIGIFCLMSPSNWKMAGCKSLKIKESIPLEKEQLF